MSDKVIVVSAAIVNVQAKRLFVQRRSGDTTYPWHWVTPGGKAHPNELAFVALRRELQEEHGVTLSELAMEWGRLVYESDVRSTRTGDLMKVCCYMIPDFLVEGTYSAGPSVAGFDWVSADELETLMLGPADAANRDKLLGLIR